MGGLLRGLGPVRADDLLLPTVLAYVATNFAYIIDPKLASNGIYIAAMLVVLYWGSVVISGRGLKTGSSSLASKGTVIGTLIPGLVLVGLAASTSCRAMPPRRR